VIGFSKVTDSVSSSNLPLRVKGATDAILFPSRLGWCWERERPKWEAIVREEQRNRKLPPWQNGEFDQNGNRFWMIDFNGSGKFVKYVEYVPKWLEGTFEFYGKTYPKTYVFQKSHPSLQPDILFRTDLSPEDKRYFGYFWDVIDKFIYPELPPPPGVKLTEAQALCLQRNNNQPTTALPTSSPTTTWSKLSAMDKL